MRKKTPVNIHIIANFLVDADRMYLCNFILKAAEYHHV